MEWAVDDVARQDDYLIQSKRHHNGTARKRKNKKWKGYGVLITVLFYFSYGVLCTEYFIFRPGSILWSNLIHQTLSATVSTDYYNTDTNWWVSHLFIWQKRQKMAESSILFESVTIYIYIIQAWGSPRHLLQSTRNNHEATTYVRSLLLRQRGSTRAYPWNKWY